MPIYEYVCSACGHDFEAIVGVRTQNPACPQCEAATEKKISLSAFHLKGGGWYSDAYAGSDNKKPGESKSSAGDSSSSSGASSSDAAASSSGSSSSESKSSPSTGGASSSSKSTKSTKSAKSSGGSD